MKDTGKADAAFVPTDAPTAIAAAGHGPDIAMDLSLADFVKHVSVEHDRTKEIARALEHATEAVKAIVDGAQEEPEKTNVDKFAFEKKLHEANEGKAAAVALVEKMCSVQQEAWDIERRRRAELLKTAERHCELMKTLIDMASGWATERKKKSRRAAAKSDYHRLKYAKLFKAQGVPTARARLGSELMYYRNLESVSDFPSHLLQRVEEFHAGMLDVREPCFWNVATSPITRIAY